MARRSVPPAQDDLDLTPSAEYVPATLDDARLVDLESEQQSPFLRAQKRVSVRRGSLPRKTAHRLKRAAAVAAVLMVLAIVAGLAMQYGAHSWRFTIESGDDIAVAGNHKHEFEQAPGVGDGHGSPASCRPAATPGRRLLLDPGGELPQRHGRRRGAFIG